MSDASVFSFLFNLAHKNQFLDLLVIFLAEYFIFILALIAAVLILKEKDWHRRYYFAALAVISTILSRGIFTELIQFYYSHPRPFVVMDFTPLINHAATGSFPSGHMAFFSIVLTVWLVSRRAGIWFVVGAFLIGLARVVSGIHWPTDILAGAAVGILSFLITFYLLKFPPKADPPQAEKGTIPNVRTSYQS